jgi:hypothetical protein
MTISSHDYRNLCSLKLKFLLPYSRCKRLEQRDTAVGRQSGKCMPEAFEAQ